jgi:hypothetical protein
MTLVYYTAKAHFCTNVEEFKKFVERNPNVEFRNPSPVAAPWHVQATVNGVLINFWPHKMKGQIDGERCKSGAKALQAMVDECEAHGDFHVVD